MHISNEALTDAEKSIFQLDYLAWDVVVDHYLPFGPLHGGELGHLIGIQLATVLGSAAGGGILEDIIRVDFRMSFVICLKVLGGRTIEPVLYSLSLWDFTGDKENVSGTG